MLRFQLDGRGGETKRCQKMRQRAHLDSMGRKRDMAWRVATSTGGEAAPLPEDEKEAARSS
jgi:hypothetical protein